MELYETIYGWAIAHRRSIFMAVNGQLLSKPWHYESKADATLVYNKFKHTINWLED